MTSTAVTLYILLGIQGPSGGLAPQPSACFERIQRLGLGSQSDYRAPAKADIWGGWQFVREEYGAEPSCVQADFNGDGLVDYATVGIRRGRQGHGVFLLLSTPHGFETQEIFATAGDAVLAQESLLRVVKPGKYDAFHGCLGLDVALELKLTRPGIDYYARQERSRQQGDHRVKPIHSWFHIDEGGVLRTTNLCSDVEWERLLKMGY